MKEHTQAWSSAKSLKSSGRCSFAPELVLKVRPDNRQAVLNGECLYLAPRAAGVLGVS